MTQEDKELLLKDLCVRVPYKTRVSYTYEFAGAVGINGYTVKGILSYEKLQHFSLPNIGCERRWLAHILPYLRPMSSMNEEEREELEHLSDEYFGTALDKQIEELVSSSSKEGSRVLEYIASSVVTDWLNAHHFDYRGLIEKGLALEAPEDMYKTE